MSESYYQLLDAAVQHLEQMRSGGARFVSVSAGTLSELGKANAERSTSNFQRSTSNNEPRTAQLRTSNIEHRTSNFEVRNPGGERAAAKVALPNSNIERPTSNVQLPTSGNKAAALNEIRERALACLKCGHLASTRKNVVFGVGNPEAQLMFVGEAPGADEDLAGEPFVGAAGQLLTKMIQAMGLSREQVYIANILKCRPDMPAGSSGNRKPTPEEMKTCIPYLHAQIDVIQPKVLVALGATAVEGLLGIGGISKLRGNWKEYRGTPLMPTYHPAYLLRNQAMSEKRRVWEDLLAVMEKLELPISEKQRNYFLRG